MIYCSNCGKELKGAKNFCSNCGYSNLDTDEEPTTKHEDDAFETEPVSDPDGPVSAGDDVPGSGDMNEIPADAIIVDKTCTQCGEKGEKKCFFCNLYVCDRHLVNMQVLADKAGFGDIITACGNCADSKNNKQPTEAEAKKIGFFFKIKEYHQWAILQ